MAARTKKTPTLQDAIGISVGLSDDDKRQLLKVVYESMGTPAQWQHCHWLMHEVKNSLVHSQYFGVINHHFQVEDVLEGKLARRGKCSKVKAEISRNVTTPSLQSVLLWT